MITTTCDHGRGDAELRIHDLRAPLRRPRVALSEVVIGCGVTALLGPNGAGKSTLLAGLSVSGLRGESNADVEFIRDEHVISWNEVRRSVLPQSPQLPKSMRANELLTFVAGVRGVRQLQIAELAARTEIERLLERRADRLSGGERARLNLAIALIGDPDLLLLDEPSAALDIGARDKFLTVLRAESRSRVVLMATHQPADLEYAEHVLVLNAGRLRWSGSVAQFRGQMVGSSVESVFLAMLGST